MFTWRAKPIRIIGYPNNQPPDSVVPLYNLIPVFYTDKQFFTAYTTTQFEIRRQGYRENARLSALFPLLHTNIWTPEYRLWYQHIYHLPSVLKYTTQQTQLCTSHSKCETVAEYTGFAGSHWSPVQEGRYTELDDPHIKHCRWHTSPIVTYPWGEEGGESFSTLIWTVSAAGSIRFPL
jgi:hypothetical protein